MRSTARRLLWGCGLLVCAGCEARRGVVLYRADADQAGSAGSAGAPARGGAPGLFQPTPDVAWQIQLTGSVETGVAADMFIIDLEETSAIAELRGQGRDVVCYFSAGSSEPFRADSARLPDIAQGATLPAYPDERWLDIRNAEVRAVMNDRMRLAAARGCRGVQPESQDGYLNETGFGLTAEDQADYSLFLAQSAHAAGLGIGLTGSGEALWARLEPSHDWAFAYDCLQAAGCAGSELFVDQGKAALVAESIAEDAAEPAEYEQICSSAREMRVNAIIKRRTLDAFRIACD